MPDNYDYFVNLPKNQKEAAKNKNRKDYEDDLIEKRTKEGPPEGMA